MTVNCIMQYSNLDFIIFLADNSFRAEVEYDLIVSKAVSCVEKWLNRF